MCHISKILSSKVILLLLLLILCLKVCNCQQNNDSTVRMHAVSKSKDTLKRYFRHEPYGPGTYAFGFEVYDIKSGNRQFRDERRFLNGTVEGSYGYVLPDGRIIITHFIADSKNGYLSQTHTFQEGEMDTDQAKWRKYFWKFEEDNRKDQKTTMKNQLDSNTEQSPAPDHIDLEKDLLNPTLSKIINGNLLSKNNGTTKQPEMTIFQNVIPNQFPIVPFELPQKILKNLDSTDDGTKIFELQNNRMGNGGNEKNTRESKEKKDSVEEKIDHTDSSGQSDWISSFVNETRKEFIDNMPTSS